MFNNGCNLITVVHVCNLIIEERRIFWEDILKNNVCCWQVPRKTWRSLIALELYPSSPALASGSEWRPGAEGKEHGESLSLGRSQKQGKAPGCPVGRGDSVLCTQSKPHLEAPLLAHRLAKLKDGCPDAPNRPGHLWIHPQLASILSKPTFVPRHWPSMSKAEVTSPTLGKASQTGFARTNPKRESKCFIQYAREHPVTF